MSAGKIPDAREYVMVFAFTRNKESLLMLRKPRNHRNPIFRGKWTVPGGHLERGEDARSAAVREFQEETGLRLKPSTLRFVLSFACNCDRTEPEHTVSVFAVMVAEDMLLSAAGSDSEPVRLWAKRPRRSLWYSDALVKLAKGRLAQRLAEEIGRQG